MTDLERQLMARFHTLTLRGGVCAVCGYRGPHLQAHHILAKGVLRRALKARVTEGQLASIVWDPRNGLALCAEPAPNRCHQRHELRMWPIPRGKVPGEAWEFAQDLDERFGGGAEPFQAHLERVYAREAA